MTIFGLNYQSVNHSFFIRQCNITSKQQKSVAGCQNRK